MTPDHLTMHPDRQTILQEMHARPFMTLNGRFRIFFFAFLGTEQDRQQRRSDLDRLLTAGKFIIRFDSGMNVEAEAGSWQLRWENHSEFSSFTMMVPLNEAPANDPAMSCIPLVIRDCLPDNVFEAVDLVLDNQEVTNFLAGGEHFGSLLGSGNMLIRTSLKADSQGFVRVFAHNLGENERGAGRKIQLLLELMIYQKLALLGLPLARKFGPVLQSLDERVGILARDVSVSDSDDNILLGKISSKMHEIEQVAADISYRFSASRAYQEIVDQRLSQLREQRVSGMQTLKEFVERRLEPAMKTCDSVESRQVGLSVRTRTLADLLSARVNVSLERQNSELLQSMDRRAKMQLRLQETVEGLSIVAISYYGVGLASYLWKTAKAVNLIEDPVLWTGLSLPPVVLTVWLSVRRIRKGMDPR